LILSSEGHMTEHDRIKNFDTLPDDAIVSSKITAILLSESERTLRRHPPIQRIQMSARRVGFRVGDIRAFVRGEVTPAA
jgi:hypothetical protein